MRSADLREESNLTNCSRQGDDVDVRLRRAIRFRCVTVAGLEISRRALAHGSAVEPDASAWRLIGMPWLPASTERQDLVEVVERLFLTVLISTMAGQLAVGADDDPVTAWHTRVEIRPVLDADSTFHSIHTYYKTCPESPDGTRVLFFRSKTPEAQLGDVYVLGRRSNEVRVLARNVVTEDAHRAACQQWGHGGKMVVFHELRDYEWQIVSADRDDRR